MRRRWNGSNHLAKFTTLRSDRYLDARTFYAASLSDNGRHDEALKVVRDLVTSTKATPSAFVDVVRRAGWALLQLGRYQEALDLYTEFSGPLETSDSSDYDNAMAYTLALLGRDLDRAERLARRATGRDRESHANRGTLGAVLVQAGDPAVGVQLLEAALDVPTRPPDRFETLRFLAIGHRRLGNDAEADNCLRLAAEAHPPFVARLEQV